MGDAMPKRRSDGRTEEEIQYIKELREQGVAWKDIPIPFETKFGKRRNQSALFVSYKRAVARQEKTKSAKINKIFKDFFKTAAIGMFVIQAVLYLTISNQIIAESPISLPLTMVIYFTITIFGLGMCYIVGYATRIIGWWLKW